MVEQMIKHKHCLIYISVLVSSNFIACSPEKKSDIQDQPELSPTSSLPSKRKDSRKEVVAPAIPKPKITGIKAQKTDSGKNHKIYELQQRKILGFRFEAFPVKEQYYGKSAPLDLVSHEDARYYRKTLTRGMEIGSNFAGKYTLVSIDCGTACQENYIIETQTGRVLDKVKSTLGASFRSDSRLLIINPPEPTVTYTSCLNCEPVVYVMENSLLYKAKLIK
jgi:hypothetical protein